MRRPRRAMTAPSASRPGNAAHLVRRLAATLLAVAAGSQATAQHEAAAESFAGLPDAVQQQVVERVAQRLREIPAARRILDLAADCPRPGPAPTSGHHDEKIYAPVAPTRQRIQPGQPLHQKTQQSMPPVLPLQGVAATLVYDWATGRACAAPAQPSAQARFQSLLDGYVPGSDRAAVALLSWIDDDGGQRKVADWFGHLYADRMGRVFVGITLYDAWASGQTVEVPDPRRPPPRPSLPTDPRGIRGLPRVPHPARGAGPGLPTRNPAPAACLPTVAAAAAPPLGRHGLRRATRCPHCRQQVAQGTSGSTGRRVEAGRELSRCR